MTNGERIRLMSDEELASFLEGLPAHGCACCSCDDDDAKCEKTDCEDGIIEWLKQEAGNGRAWK